MIGNLSEADAELFFQNRQAHGFNCKCELGLKNGPNHELPDSALILAAYEKWGERCPEQLLGDFAFALWDRRQRKLFCAR